MLQSMIAEHGSICSADLTYQMSGHASTPKVNGVRNQSDSNMHVYTVCNFITTIVFGIWLKYC